MDIDVANLSPQSKYEGIPLHYHHRHITTHHRPSQLRNSTPQLRHQPLFPLPLIPYHPHPAFPYLYLYTLPPLLPAKSPQLPLIITILLHKSAPHRPIRLLINPTLPIYTTMVSIVVALSYFYDGRERGYQEGGFAVKVLRIAPSNSCQSVEDV